MGRLSEDYYSKKMEKFNMTQTGKGYKLSLNFDDLGRKLDHAQDALDAAVWDSVRKRMPLDLGTLQSQTNALNVNERGRVYLYPPDSAYGHFQYVGKLMIGELSRSPFAMAGEKKVYAEPEVKLNYSQPNAVARWGEVAFEEDSSSWYDVVKRAMGG